MRSILSNFAILLLSTVFHCGAGLVFQESQTGPESPECLRKLGDVIEFAAPNLRMEYLHLDSATLEVVDFAGRGEYSGMEEWRTEIEMYNDGYVMIKLTAEKNRVSRRIEYLLFCDIQEVNDEDTENGLRPLLATEYAIDLDSDKPLYRRQTMNFSLIVQASGKTVRPDPEKALFRALEDTSRIISAEVVDKLSDYLWHHQHLDSPPGSYNGILDLLQRRIEIQPRNISQYADAAWLWWSKWVTWKENHERMPDGENGLKQALTMLYKGQAAKPASARYYFEAAMTMRPVARFHEPEIYDFVTAFLLKAEEFGTEEETGFRVRVRLSIAHMYREKEMHRKAVDWYRQVLELEPENRIAARYIERLTGDKTEQL